jgi:hypothetical protein
MFQVQKISINNPDMKNIGLTNIQYLRTNLIVKETAI